MARLTKRAIDSARRPASGDIRLWDDNPRGLGLRVKASGVRTFFFQYRSPVDFRKRRYTIGQYGAFTLEQAQAEARKLAARVADGIDPQLAKRAAKSEALSTAVTISALCEEYLADARGGLVTYRGRPKKESTLNIDDGRVERHIKPLLGPMLARDVTGADVERFMHDVRLGKTAAVVKTGPRGKARVTGGATTASRTVDLLGSVFSYAIKRGVRTDNPVAGIERPPPVKRDRVLSPDEYARLGTALDELERAGAKGAAIRAARVLALTGCRRGEILALKRTEVDGHGQCLRLADTKAGQQVRPIGRAPMELLLVTCIGDESPWVFPASRGDGHLVDVKTIKEAIESAKLKGVTIHTLRHAFASVANELGYSELVIGGLLGHRSHSITGRYAHHVDRALVAAADRVASVIWARLQGQEDAGAKVVSIGGEGR